MKVFYLAAILFFMSSLVFGQSPKSAGDLTIDVEGGKSVTLKSADMAKLERRDVRAKGHDGVDSTYSGIELRKILAPQGAKLGKDLRGPSIAQYVVVEAADGYRAVFSMTDLEPEFTDDVVILADKRDGKLLADTHGPWQIISTGEKKHGRWVRQVTAIRVRTAK